MKSLLIIFLVLMLSVAVVPMAQADCAADLNACEQLLDESTSAIPADCEELCKDKCGWVVLVKDKTFVSAVIGGVVLLIGGVAGIFITGGN